MGERAEVAPGRRKIGLTRASRAARGNAGYRAKGRDGAAKPGISRGRRSPGRWWTGYGRMPSKAAPPLSRGYRYSVLTVRARGRGQRAGRGDRP